MSRTEFTAKTRRAAFDRCQGKCEECSTKLFVGKFHYDHVMPDWFGGEPTLENCAVLCTACHGAKTARVDVPRIAKTKRQRDAHIGARAPSSRPIPGSKRSPWKAHLDGTFSRRQP